MTPANVQLNKGISSSKFYLKSFSKYMNGWMMDRWTTKQTNKVINK